jgi:hypothetical protein
MRPLMVGFGLFLYVAMDITVNNGSSVHGWLSFLSSVAHTTGLH